MKEVKIYVPMDVPRGELGDSFEGTPTYDMDEAMLAARMDWAHLTSREQKKREIYVGCYTFEVPDDDARPAAQAYKEIIDDMLWIPDHDRIDLPEE